jgi:hypothetical protein
MSVVAALYLIVIAGFGAWAIVDDLREGQSRLRVTMDVLAIGVLGYLYAGYFVRPLIEPLGKAAAPLFILAFLWTGIAAHREIVVEDNDPDLSPRANFVAEHLGILIGVVIFSPLVAFGGMAAWQLWQGV